MIVSIASDAGSGKRHGMWRQNFCSPTAVRTGCLEVHVSAANIIRTARLNCYLICTLWAKAKMEKWNTRESFWN